MLKHRVWVFLGVFLSQLVLSVLMDDPWMPAMIVLGVFLPGYLFVSMRRQRRRVALLDEACDPEAFIEATRRQHAITGRDKWFSNLLRLDLTAGLGSAGRFEEALETLEGLDERCLSRNPITRHAMTINRYVVLRGLARHSEADALYLASIQNAQSFHGGVRNALYMAMLDFELHQGNLAACREGILTLEQRKLTKRYALHLEYIRGRLALAEGEDATARSHLERVASDGAKLHVGKEAKRLIEGLSVHAG